MKFASVINCMDGRIQEPVIRYVKESFGVSYVDNITEAGPNLILAEGKDLPIIEAIQIRLDISINLHGSIGIAVVGHHDCARNPAPREKQLGHLERAVRWVKAQYPDTKVIALWVNEKWEVEEVTDLIEGPPNKA